MWLLTTRLLLHAHHVVQYEATPADLHIAGTPCTDYSPRGAMRGLDGPTTGFLFCWLAMRILLDDTYVLQENVVSFITSILSEVLGRKYHVDHIVIDAKCLGWPISRRRKYTILRHKLKCGAMSQPLNDFARIFLQDPNDVQNPQGEDLDDEVSPWWSIFFFAGPKELREELMWAASRPQSTWTGDTDDLNPLDLKNFWRVLTATEQQVLEQYRALAPGQCYQLNQNPEVTATTSTQRHMFTIIKNAGIIWLLDCGGVCVNINN